MQHQEVLLVDDLFLLSEAQMCRIEAYFPLSHGIPRVDNRLTCVSDHLRHQERSTVARCTPALRAVQDDLQPLYPLKPTGRVQPHLCRVGGTGR